MSDNTRCELSDIDTMGDDWGFTLYDPQGEEMTCFAFRSETAARTAHKMMCHIIADATAIVPAKEAPARFWFAFEFPAMDPIDVDTDYLADMEAAHPHFGINNVEQIAPIVPMIRMAARTVEEAKREAHAHWLAGSLLKPYGRTPIGFSILGPDMFPVAEEGLDAEELAASWPDVPKPFAKA